MPIMVNQSAIKSLWEEMSPSIRIRGWVANITAHFLFSLASSITERIYRPINVALNKTKVKVNLPNPKSDGIRLNRRKIGPYG